MKKWEYKMQPIWPRDAEDELNKLGSDGWELVSASVARDGTPTAFLKREILGQAPADA